MLLLLGLQFLLKLLHLLAKSGEDFWFGHGGARQENLMYAIIAKADKFMNGMSPLAQSSDYGLRHAPELDFGGAHLSILAPNGDALSITSGLNGSPAESVSEQQQLRLPLFVEEYKHEIRDDMNVCSMSLEEAHALEEMTRDQCNDPLWFGSMFVTPSGLLLNNYMAAFAKPGRQLDLEPSPANRLGPGKRPLTSMVPTIITEGKAPANIFGIFGASGGLEGLSAMAQATMLREMGHSVVLRSLKSTASGIIYSGNRTWRACSDDLHGDGESAGS
ncbi:hypothetical protein HPB49_005306 [Dermacentor silvarum]|uniref:Uncharacterized protein n=1 Tax=Dermacentor silvarum TaxID=543639 RepID=A0ACB8DMQ0_DERSI|nr:hypothetical protein HPB49_005306 [Dermacentor silvarum]